MSDYDIKLAQLMSVTERSPEECASALEAAGGDVDAALSMLFDFGTEAASHQGPSVVAPHVAASMDAPFSDIGTPQTTSRLNEPLPPPRVPTPDRAELGFDPLSLRGPMGEDFMAAALRDLGYQPILPPTQPHPLRDFASGGGGFGHSYFPPSDSRPTRRRAAESVNEFCAPPWVITSANMTLAQACTEAFGVQKWVLLSAMPSRDRFVTGCVNRDLWKNETVMSLMQSSFVVYQCFATEPDDRQMLQNYRLDCTSEPEMVVIHPLTRAIRERLSARLFSGRDGAASPVNVELFTDRVIAFVDAAGRPAMTSSGATGQGLTLNQRQQPSTTTTAARPVDVDAAGGEHADRGPIALPPAATAAIESTLATGGRAAPTAPTDSAPKHVSPPPPPPPSESALLPQVTLRSLAVAAGGLELRLKLPNGKEADFRLPPNTTLAALAEAAAVEVADATSTAVRAVALMAPGMPPRKIYSQKAAAAVTDVAATLTTVGSCLRSRDRITVQFE